MPNLQNRKKNNFVRSSPYYIDGFIFYMQEDNIKTGLAKVVMTIPKN